MKGSWLEYRLLYGAVFHKKVRLFLSVLGIIIGVASLVVMVSVGEGAKKKVLREFETFGSDTIVVMAGKAVVRGGRAIQMELATTLKLEDARPLKRLYGVKRVAPVYDNTVVVEYGRNAASTVAVGTTPAFSKIRRYRLWEGRFFTREEAWKNAKKVVIGWKVKEELFPREDPLGKTIRIRKLPFKVVGVMEKMGTDASGKDQDDQVIVPITSAMNRLFNVDYIKSIFVQVESEGLIDAVARMIDDVMKKRHLILNGKERDYSIVKAEEILKYKKKSAVMFSGLIASISVISLLVGSFGVMAAMMLAVKERKREIGIRKAFGATRGRILFHFLVESLFITLVGGVLGIALGILISLLAIILAHYPFVLPVKPAVIAIVVTVVFGVFSGLYPAKKAADVDPIASIRD